VDYLDKQPKLGSQKKKPLGRPRCGWVDNMKMGFTDVGWGGIN
jgi:hypothetical protein